MRLAEKEIEKHLRHYVGKSDLREPGIRFKFSYHDADHTNLLRVLNMAQKGDIKPCIDSVYDFDNIGGKINIISSTRKNANRCST